MSQAAGWVVALASVATVVAHLAVCALALGV